MLSRVSMAEVAAQAGVAQSTVSRALKNDRRISAAQRERIRSVAQALGYRPNPMVSALMAARRSPRVETGVETIAMISSYANPREWADKPTCVTTFAGITQRAAELGFKIEIFATRDYQNGSPCLEKVLHARGIRGVMIGFSAQATEHYAFDSSGFAMAGLAGYFPNLGADRSDLHGYHNVRLGLQRLRELGYTRLGLVAPRYNNMLAGNTWSAAFLEDQSALAKSRRCEPFLPDTWMPDLATFEHWLDRYEQDCLFVYKVDVLRLLSKLGRRVPGDIGVAFLFRTEQERKSAAGVDENYFQLGRVTVDLVVEKLHTNQFGPATPTKEVMVKGVWRDGPTVRIGKR